jgi:hypothetical protein
MYHNANATLAIQETHLFHAKELQHYHQEYQSVLTHAIPRHVDQTLYAKEEEMLLPANVFRIILATHMFLVAPSASLTLNVLQTKPAKDSNVLIHVPWRVAVSTPIARP